MTPQQMVTAFTKAVGQPVDAPVTPELAQFRNMLIREECAEASYELLQDPVDIAALTKELADILYVVYGTATAMGLPLEEAFERVHQSNMSKLDTDYKPLKDETGKVLKGPFYKPPDLTDLFNE